jgi:flagellar biosynthesis GTPase FlhF
MLNTYHQPSPAQQLGAKEFLKELQAKKSLIINFNKQSGEGMCIAFKQSSSTGRAPLFPIARREAQRAAKLWSKGSASSMTWTEFDLMATITFTNLRCCFPCWSWGTTGNCYHQDALRAFVGAPDLTDPMNRKLQAARGRGRKRRKRARYFVQQTDGEKARVQTRKKYKQGSYQDKKSTKKESLSKKNKQKKSIKKEQKPIEKKRKPIKKDRKSIKKERKSAEKEMKSFKNKKKSAKNEKASRSKGDKYERNYWMSADDILFVECVMLGITEMQSATTWKVFLKNVTRSMSVPSTRRRPKRRFYCQVIKYRRCRQGKALAPGNSTYTGRWAIDQNP